MPLWDVKRKRGGGENKNKKRITKIASEIDRLCSCLRNNLFLNGIVFVVPFRNSHELAAVPTGFKSGFSAFLNGVPTQRNYEDAKQFS